MFTMQRNSLKILKSNLLFFIILSCLTVQAQSAETTCASPVVEKPRPDIKLPWSNYSELCAADFGVPWTDGIPVPPAGMDWAQYEDSYGEKTQAFLRAKNYRKPVGEEGGLGWLHDARWRVTGDWAGCPTADGPKWTNEVHPAVRIYYSPEVMKWLCDNRVPGKEVENPPPMPDGAMIIKEMHTAENLAYRPNTSGTTIIHGKEVAKLGDVWVDANYDDTELSWTIMTKGQQSFDGWYWGFFADTPATPAGCTAPPPTFNPPIKTRSALTTAYDATTEYPLEVDECGKPKSAAKQNPPPLGPWFPTYWQYSKPDITFPNAEFGNYCIYCHGSAQSQSTFASLDNILGTEIEYAYLKDIPPAPAPTPNITSAGGMMNEHGLKMGSTEAAQDESRSPFPEYNPLNKSAFEKVYPQFAGLSYDDVWQHRLPAETYDHAVSSVDGPEQYLTSDQCLSCHDAGGSGQRLPNMVVVREDGKQINLTEHAEWSVSPMGLGGRDPVFYAMLESELNRAEGETDLEKFIPCIQNTCLHCHGNMGQRQHALDTTPAAVMPIQPASTDLCAKFEPLTDPNLNPPGTPIDKLQYWTPEQRAASGYGGEPFLLDYMSSWHGGADPGNAKYGGLGRDGISCATCHHIADQDLGNSGITFSGNFRVGPADELYGPFDNVLTKPMERGLGITPMEGSALNKSSLCGSCHAIYLPVFNNDGKYVRSSFEQTTYLEWANSAFNEENNNVPASDWRSCQQCHMSDDFVYVGSDGKNHTVDMSKTRIANIQDNTFPKAEFEQQDLDLAFHDYKRHTMYGLNAFINAYFQQFPLLLGFRQQSYMSPNTVSPLLTAREEVLLIARQATAELSISNVKKSSSAISAEVTVKNLSGHKLPSGVGFRRAFIEYKILDVEGNAIWASGLTSDVGLIQDGLTGTDLPSELLQAAAGGDCPLDYQTHYEVITKPCQAQIYEELSKDSSGAFTTSFIHRYTELKDNRLLPKGYRVFEGGEEQADYCAPWCMEANPEGKAETDPDYMGSGPKGVKGQDSVIYNVSLSADQLSKAVSISATLYSQATAPYFLNQRFNDAAAGTRKNNTKRLYFLQGHLNTDAKAEDGSAYLDDYKLFINGATATVN